MKTSGCEVLFMDRIESVSIPPVQEVSPDKKLEDICAPYGNILCSGISQAYRQMETD